MPTVWSSSRPGSPPRWSGARWRRCRRRTGCGTRWRRGALCAAHMTGSASCERHRFTGRGHDLNRERAGSHHEDRVSARLQYGNGAEVAEEFGSQMAAKGVTVHIHQMAAKGVTVHIHHIQEARPKELPPADLYLFS